MRRGTRLVRHPRDRSRRQADTLPMLRSATYPIQGRAIQATDRLRRKVTDRGGVEAAASTTRTRPRTAGARAEPAGTRGGGSARELRACILDAAPARPPRTAARPALPTPVPLLTSQQPRKCVKDWMIKREMITRRTPPLRGLTGMPTGCLNGWDDKERDDNQTTPHRCPA